MKKFFFLLPAFIFFLSCSSKDTKAPQVEIPDLMQLNANANVGIQVGDVAPDIQLPNAKGELLSLSDYRGNYVIIDFWASWCGPCRMENPHVKKLYQKYHEKGLEIFGVALDRDKDSWLAAVKYDGLVWPQVSDLKWWESQVVPLYQIQGIPHTLLLDKEGRILAKNLRGTYLDAKLRDVFGS